MNDQLVPIPSPGVPLYYGEEGDPLVIIVHDWYGRLPSLEPMALALASQHFRVTVPDLYDGVCTVDEQTAQRLLERLDVHYSLSTIDGIIEDARDIGSERVGLMGFSMGGWLCLLHAQGGLADAAVAYYASLSPSDHGAIPCPVLLHYAEFDDWAPGEEPEQFVSQLGVHGTPVTEFSYEGTQHSFANASIASKLDAASAGLAFARSASFLEEHLQL